MNEYYNYEERIISYFGCTLDQYLKLDRETKDLLQLAYWDLRNKKIEERKNTVKTKVLSIFNKRK